ncbi:MAG TPA: cupin domain-containing protein [Acidimicrobiales bacterium]|nr:cupin domain-containing protein [Acidimicrobiales bacterium]
MSATHDMRVLVTGVDGQGRSCVVGDDRVPLTAIDGGVWFGSLFETATAPPVPLRHGEAPHLEVALAPGLARWQVIDYPPGQTYPMHHTDTIDFDIVLAGSIELTLDDGVHVLETGDGVVVNGVDHAWAAGPDGARLSVMFIGTRPR